MEEVLTTDTATQLVGKVNTNLGSEVISTDDTAAEAVDALNEAFAGTTGADTLSVNDSATDFVEKLNGNFELYEGGEPSVSNQFRFLHFSDPHGSDTAADKCVEMVGQNDGIDAVFVTGDLIKYGTGVGTGVYETDLAAALASLADKVLVLAGNHDTAEIFNNPSQDQERMTALLKTVVVDEQVNWGDTNNVASFYHRDYMVGENIVRYISIDQYEYTAVAKPTLSSYLTVYSQKQINWLIEMLQDTPSGYYVIIAMHEPQCVQNSTFVNAQRDGQDLFVTEKLATLNQDGKAFQRSIIPKIVNAWQNKSRFYVEDFNNSGVGAEFDIDADFSSVQSVGRFLFYLCGHNHWDMTTYLTTEDCTDQLMLCICAADSSVLYNDQDDLVTDFNSSTHTGTQVNSNEPTYRINDVVVDFDEETITITRLGTRTTDAGRYRDTITFPFEKESEE